MQSIFENDIGESNLILYQRFQGQSQMDSGAVFETEMITGSHIEGLLSCRFLCEEDTHRYRYSVTGYTSLTQKYRHEEIKSVAIRKIIEGVICIYQSAEEYLLNRNHILMNPEYVFWDLSRGGVNGCCYPLADTTFQEQLKMLAEYLIERTDHGDEEAIELSYGFYQCVQTGDYRFEQLLKRVQKEEDVRNTYEMNQGLAEYRQWPTEGTNHVGTGSSSVRQPASIRHTGSGQRGSGEGNKALLGLLSTFLIICMVICFLLLKLH